MKLTKQDIQDVIDKMEKLKSELEQSEKCELAEGVYCITTGGNLSTIWGTSNIINGATRVTKELAERASKNMVQRNRLEAWVHQIQGDGEGDSFISKFNDDHVLGKTVNGRRTLGAVYMKQETAEWICDRLNDGRVTL